MTSNPSGTNNPPKKAVRFAKGTSGATPVQTRLHTCSWEVLMLVDSEAVAWVSGAAETVDYFG